MTVVAAGCSFDSPPPAADAPDTRAVIGFATPESGADEFQSAPLQVIVQLDRPAESEITVACTVIAGGTATPGDDFTVQSQNVTFAVGEQMKPFEVTIVKDNVDDEMTESFDLELSSPSSNAKLGVATRHKVTISNVKLPRARFNNVNTSTSEGTPTDLVVNLDVPAQGASSVVVSVGGTATPVVDYAFADNTQINIADGASMGAAAIGEVDDALDEDDENIVFTIVGASPNIVLESGTTTTHAITDNDNPPTIGFALAASTVAEGVGTTQLAVQLSGPSGKTITVDVARGAGGTAEAGDLTVTTTSLTFLPGETSKTATITIDDDTLDEDDDTGNIVLANAVNATIAGGTHALTITDNDNPPNIGFVAATSMDSEGVPAHVITVQLSTASEKPISIDFAVSVASTATAPGDFSITGSSLSFAVGGGLSKSITVDVVDDSTQESPETVVIDLSNAVNASTVGQTVNHVFTIMDND